MTVQKPTHVTFSLSPELLQTLDERAKADKMNRSRLIVAAIEAYLSGEYVYDKTDMIPSYTDENTQILLLTEKVRARDEIIAVYRTVLASDERIVTPPVLPAPDRDTKDKKPGALGRFGAWLRRA